MRPLLRLARILDRLSAAAAMVAYWLMLLVVAIGTFNTLARYGGRWLGRELASNAYLELQWYLFGAIFLLAGAATLRRDGHVRVDVVFDRLSPTARASINLVGHVAFLVPFCVLMLVVSWRPVLESWRIGELSPDPDGLPRYWIKSLIPVAFLLLLLQSLAEIVHQVARLRGLEPRDDATADGVTEAAGGHV